MNNRFIKPMTKGAEGGNTIIEFSKFIINWEAIVNNFDWDFKHFIR